MSKRRALKVLPLRLTDDWQPGRPAPDRTSAASASAALARGSSSGSSRKAASFNAGSIAGPKSPSAIATAGASSSKKTSSSSYIPVPAEKMAKSGHAVRAPGHRCCSDGAVLPAATPLGSKPSCLGVVEIAGRISGGLAFHGDCAFSAPHLGQTARLPPKNGLTLSLCPLGHVNLMPMGSPARLAAGQAVTTHPFPDRQRTKRRASARILNYT